MQHRSPRRIRPTLNNEPKIPGDCPTGTYFRQGQTRDFLGQPRYYPAVCAPDLYEQAMMGGNVDLSSRRIRGTLSNEPRIPGDCPTGTYFRQGQTRDFLGQPRYYPGVCAPDLYDQAMMGGQGRSNVSRRRRMSDMDEPQENADCPPGTFLRHSRTWRNLSGQQIYEPGRCIEAYPDYSPYKQTRSPNVIYRG